jgi:hypothetical protein
MNGPVDVSPAMFAWEKFRDFAQSKGWTVELTPCGRTMCAKRWSIIFGPGSGTDYADLINRLGYVDGFMKKHSSGRK